MKKIYAKFIYILIAGCSFTGCFDLDYENYNKINSENFPESEADLHAATIGVYNTLGKSFVMQWLNTADWTLNTLTTDELNTSWGNPWQQTERFLWTPNDMAAKDCYAEYQKGVTKATRLIDAFQQSAVEDAKKNKYIAELRTLRVMYANYLYSMVGAVPIVTDPDIANDVYTEWKPKRPASEEYVSFMTKEILESYELLDIQQSAEDIGRFSQGAALTLLMKIYMNDRQWQNAVDITRKIMDLGVYDLMPTYKSVFDINNEGISNIERILPIQRITSNQTYAWTYFSSVMPATPTYKSQVGGQINISGGLKMPWAFYDKYESNDSRLETIVRYYTDTDGNWVDFRTVDHPKATGAAPMKYTEDPEQQGAMQGNDFIVYRYADVLLSRAEALNEINGPTTESIGLINLVRARANASLLKPEDYTKETLRDFLLDERGRELYCEGHRRPDLIRFGKFIEKAREKGINAQDYHVLFPIPQSAMDENPNLVQNPGYEN
jgi:hypothetical protein